jgi:hypothetical protein
MEISDFVIGGTYENMKGAYEVLSIKGEEMTIRWESGETIQTPIDLQVRIIERMKREREAKKQAQLSKKSKACGRAKKFQGFSKEAFSTSVKGQTWRGRTSLGGAVTAALDNHDFRINSWAVDRRPVVHWADETHRKSGKSEQQAKLFVQLDPSGLFFGFHVERSPDSDPKSTDWTLFSDWLAQEENEKWLHETCQSHQLSLRDPDQSVIKGLIVAGKKGWSLQGAGKKKSFGSLSEYLQSLSADQGMNLQVFQAIEKDIAVSLQTEVAKTIAETFDALMPLYAASLKR